MIVDMISGQTVSPNRVFTKEEVEEMIVRFIKSDDADIKKMLMDILTDQEKVSDAHLRI